MNWFCKRSSTREIQLQVKDLQCEMCAQTVREALQKVTGVTEYSAVKAARTRVDVRRKGMLAADTTEMALIVGQQSENQFISKTSDSRDYQRSKNCCRIFD